MSEVGALDMRMVPQVRRRTVGHDAPFFEHVGAPREVERHRHVLLHQEHRDARGR